VKPLYRPEIDGLRAIAVGAVILYHADITILDKQLFRGGFIGVDIFFVISGYLITSIILKELITTGSFSFKYFYERRVRRILPTLLIVMLVTFVFAWMYILPNSFIDFSKSILYSLSFISNFYFYHSGQQYGAESGSLKPFLHTWSLSIEEQFYILFPIVLLIIFKFFRKYLIYTLILGFFISLGYADWSSSNYPSISFYFIHTRAWELLAGSILAYFEIIKGHRSKNPILNSILPMIGLFLIGKSFIFFHDQMFHPSLYTLSPIIGVCLIIWFSNQDEIISKILSTKLFVGIGLISYSLYLWHYPIFALIKITNLVMGNLILKFCIVPFLFFISIVSYHFIEKPFRYKKYHFKNLLIIILTLIFLLFFLNNYVIINNGFKNRFPQIFQDELVGYNFNLFQKEDLQKVILVGDSHAEALQYNLNEDAKKNNLSFFYLPSKFFLKNFNMIEIKTKKERKYFVEENVQIQNFLNENSNLIVIFHYRWAIRILNSYYKDSEDNREKTNLNYHSYFEPFNTKKLSLTERQNSIRNSLLSEINEIISQGHKLILVYPVPELGFNPTRSLFRKFIIDNNIFENSSSILSVNFDSFKNRNKLVFEILDSVDNPNIFRVYPHKFFCNTLKQNRCVANDKNSFFYYDDDHLSSHGSKLVVEEIMNKINP
jgi:peptidoglycan/LPS O-acetylase OafA/YrhL